MSKNVRAVVLLSGGIDSVSALYHAQTFCEIAACLSFEYGAKHNAREIPLARHHAKTLGYAHVTLALPFVEEHFQSDLLKSGQSVPKGHYEEWSMQRTVVPFRNGIMLAIAAGFAESRRADAVISAAHAGDHAIYPDCRESFLRAMADAVRLGSYAGVEVIRPFIEMTKSEIVRRGAELGVDFSRTWSCYCGEELHCGECGTCVERREAFLLSGVVDPTEYASTAPLPPKPVSG